MNLHLLIDSTIEINIKEVAELINNKTTQVNVSINDKQVVIESKLMSYPQTHESIYPTYIKREINDLDDIYIVLTELPYEDNFFHHQLKNLYITSFYGWESLTTLPKENGLLYFITRIAFSFVLPSNGNRHYTETGCLKDFLTLKTSIDVGMRQAYICNGCLDKISKRNLTIEQEKLFDDVKVLLDILSQKSRWNKNILEDWKAIKKIPINTFVKRKTLKPNEINIVIASPSDTEREREILLNKLERQFRLSGFETSTGFRLIVHGWEDLASQTGYAQDIINSIVLKNVDIVVGVLKHKIGSPTFDSNGMQRAESGTIEEIYHALEKNSNSVLGMVYFYSIAPLISLDDENYETIRENWEKLRGFKKSIQNKVLYKPYSSAEDLLDLIVKDLNQNILTWFQV